MGSGDLPQFNPPPRRVSVRRGQPEEGPVPPARQAPAQAPATPAQAPVTPARRRTAGPSRPLDATPTRQAAQARPARQAGASPAAGTYQAPPGYTAQPGYPAANPTAAGAYQAGPGYPAQPGYPATGPDQTGPPGAYGPPATKRRHPVRRTLVTLLIICLLLAAYPLGLGLWANSKIQRLDVISDTADTPGRTYLIAGSDLRGSGGVNDPTEGARTDTIMLLHVATNGQAYLISIPRDTYAEIPGYSPNKINAAYAFGGPELLIQTVEKLTQLHIDHYVEVGFGSVTELVDAVGGVELCLDQDVDDQKSHLVWEAGCHLADGTTALAFSRMRYSDPLGDIGRIARQRQVVSAVMKKAITPKNLLWPPNQIDLIEAGTGALTVDKSTNIITLGRMLLDFRKATGPEGIQGVPTIATTDYEPGGIGSAILLDPDASAADFKAIADGTWEGNQADGAAD